VCREVAESELAICVTGIGQNSEFGVQSCQESHFLSEGVAKMYQALYRKWRPQTFDAVIGQEHITETLKNQVRTSHLSHAYIFIGTRGTGKTTCARILSRAVNCEHPVDGNPCCECEACKSILSGDATDIVEIDAASNNGVDNVRALRDEAVFSPTKLKKRVYIIDEVHMLSLSAFNALLKILEEPPEHLLFILATTELQKVPATILSRCQRHSFKRIEQGLLGDYIKQVSAQEKFQITDEAAMLIARLSDGGVRDSLSLLDQCADGALIDAEHVYNTLGLAGNRKTARILSCIITHRTADVLQDFHSLWMDGKDPTSVLGELCTLLRDILLYRAAPKTDGVLISGSYTTDILAKYDKYITDEEIISMLETLQKTLSEIKLSSNPKLSAEITLVSLCSSPSGDSIASLKARISSLEAKLSEVLNGKVSFSYSPTVEDTTIDRSATEYEYHEYEETPVEIQPEPQIIEAAAQKPVIDENDNTSETSTDVSQQLAQVVSQNAWEPVARRAAELVPPGLAYSLSDETQTSGEISGDLLTLKVEPGFLFGCFNKPEVLKCFEKAASEVMGMPIRVRLIELTQNSAPQRSLDDLKKFDVVKFIE